MTFDKVKFQTLLCEYGRQRAFEEIDAGYPTLRRIPSRSATVFPHFLEFNEVPLEKQKELFSYRIDRSLGVLLGQPPPMAGASLFNEWMRFRLNFERDLAEEKDPREKYKIKSRATQKLFREKLDDLFEGGRRSTPASVLAYEVAIADGWKSKLAIQCKKPVFYAQSLHFGYESFQIDFCTLLGMPNEPWHVIGSDDELENAAVVMRDLYLTSLEPVFEIIAKMRRSS